MVSEFRVCSGYGGWAAPDSQDSGHHVLYRILKSRSWGDPFKRQFVLTRFGNVVGYEEPAACKMCIYRGRESPQWRSPGRSRVTVRLGIVRDSLPRVGRPA
ncbi:hypothetical protein LIA77_02641 [Sarocladium implicatum]|nr:hypothetical protein LIA77_02641 [Sarocladium implicatum]